MEAEKDGIAKSACHLLQLCEREVCSVAKLDSVVHFLDVEVELVRTIVGVEQRKTQPIDCQFLRVPQDILVSLDDLFGHFDYFISEVGILNMRQ